MYKYIITNKKGEKYFLKKADWLFQLWTEINLKMPMGRKIPSYKNFSDIADVHEYILQRDLLSQHTLLYRVDRSKKEIWQKYLKGVDIEKCIDNNQLAALEELIRLFKSYGLISIDHDGKNALLYKKKIYLIDIESFEFFRPST